MCQLSFIYIFVKNIVYPRRLSIPGSTTVFGCSGIPKTALSTIFSKMHTSVLAYNIAN